MERIETSQAGQQASGVERPGSDLRCLVIIPTYNEIENIEAICREVLGARPTFDLLIVDDNSPDGTAEAVQTLIRHEFEGRLFLEKRSGKLGLGTAYILGFRWGLQRGYDLICEMDADFSHNPQDLHRLREAVANGGADMSVGSRYVKGGGAANWPWDRLLLSYGASLYVRTVTFLPVRDATAGFVCYSRRVLESIDLNLIKFVGYAFQIEMKFAAWSLGFKITEVPITFNDRSKGQSKMSQGIVREALPGVIMIKWRSLFRSYKVREHSKMTSSGDAVS